MINKITVSLVKIFTAIILVPGIAANATAQKELDSVRINGGIFSNSIFTFPNTKDYDFSVKGEGDQRSITMHNNIKSGKYADDITVSILIPDKGLGEYKFSKDTNPDQVELMVNIIHNLNDNAVYNHGIRAVEGDFKITSVDGKWISGTFEADGEELDLNTMATVKYTLKGNFKAVKVN